MTRCLATLDYSLTPGFHPLRYRSHKDPSYVDYKEFSDEMEAIFTVPGLEKMPTVDPQPYTPTLLMDANTLLPEEEQILERTLHRIAERVRCVYVYTYMYKFL